MLSSIGLGGVSALLQPTTAPVEARSSSSSTERTSGGAASGETSSGKGSAKAAAAGNGYGGDTPAPSSTSAVTGSQGVAPVGQSATEARTAYDRRDEPASDSDRDLAAATQRRMFRAQLIDRIGADPEPPHAAVKAASGNVAIRETELDYSY